MSALLEKLGVPKNVRLFFQPYYQLLPDGSLRFAFGHAAEHFGQSFHRIPIAIHPWLAGNGPLQFIAFSAMECLAYLAIHGHRYADFSQLQFSAIGLTRQLPPQTAASKICLLAGNDPLGCLNAIHWASSLRNKQIGIRYLSQDKYLISYLNRKIILREALLSLSAAEKGLGIRTGIRTAAPRNHTSFLEQLKHQTSWY